MQFQEIFNQLNHVLIDPEGYCEKSKVKIHESVFMNLFSHVMS